jgi:hypothetical protein
MAPILAGRIWVCRLWMYLSMNSRGRHIYAAALVFALPVGLLPSLAVLWYLIYGDPPESHESGRRRAIRLAKVTGIGRDGKAIFVPDAPSGKIRSLWSINDTDSYRKDHGCGWLVRKNSAYLIESALVYIDDDDLLSIPETRYSTEY